MQVAQVSRCLVHVDAATCVRAAGGWSSRLTSNQMTACSCKDALVLHRLSCLGIQKVLHARNFICPHPLPQAALRRYAATGFACLLQTQRRKATHACGWMFIRQCASMAVFKPQMERRSCSVRTGKVATCISRSHETPASARRTSPTELEQRSPIYS
jgi:hypothetical protein